MEEVLRIDLFQSSANYKKEETVENKMTYPLPPFSTVIGAIHNACNFKEYHPMELSIQGNYEAMIKKPYTDYCFLNSTQDDRGILVKMKNEKLLSSAFEKVASAKKSQGNSFRKGITIQVINNELLEEYRDLKKIGDEIDNFKKMRRDSILAKIKKRKKTLAEKKSKLDKNSNEFKLVEKRENEIKQLEKDINEGVKKYEEDNYKKPIAKFRTLTTSLKYYELLMNINLIIHVKSDRATLECLKENIYNLKSIGRSEDFVEVKEARFVNLEVETEETVKNPYSAYISYDLIKNSDILPKIREGVSADGTKYYLTKNYKIVEKKREFEKKKVVYLSNFYAVEESENVYFDNTDKNQKLIVNFL